jgi:glycosyltransferase involved in cell wall biosynthesis
MKINFIVPEIVRSGGIRIIFEYANRLTQRGHTVTLITPIIPFNIYKEKFNPGYFMYRIKYALKYLAGINPVPANIFEKNFKIKFVLFVNNFFLPDADAVFATAWQTAESVYRLKKSKGKKFYLIQDYEIWYGNPDKINESYTLPLNRIVISKYLQELLKKKINADSARIPIGIDFKKFRNSNKIFHNPRTILFTDHPLENKNTAGAIKIIEKIKQKYPGIVIRCYGHSRFHTMPDFVEFFENPDDDTIIRLYCDSDIFLFTSKYEGFGLPPAEAMACKCAVAGNAAGALPEYAVNNETAILTNPEKPEELFNAICHLLDNENELKRISENGFNHVKKILNWNNVLDKFEDLVSKVN